MGGIRKNKTKRGVEHHKQSLEQTLEAPETYGIRVRYNAFFGDVQDALHVYRFVFISIAPADKA